MNCKEILNYISEYIDNTLPEKERKQIEAHLNKCLKCRMLVDTLNTTLALCQELEVYKTPISIHRDLHRMLKEEWDLLRVPVSLKHPRIMATEIVIQDSKIIIRVEVPGINKSDINITCLISGHATSPDTLELIAIRNKPEGTYYINEILYGRLEKRFDLPVEIKLPGLRANIKEGILEIVAKVKQ